MIKAILRINQETVRKALEDEEVEGDNLECPGSKIRSKGKGRGEGKGKGKGPINLMDVAKAMGEGTRGGKVIGHTKSGKPIYAGGRTKISPMFSGINVPITETKELVSVRSDITKFIEKLKTIKKVNKESEWKIHGEATALYGRVNSSYGIRQKLYDKEKQRLGSSIKRFYKRMDKK